MRTIPRLLLMHQWKFLLFFRADNIDLRNLDDSKWCVFLHISVKFILRNGHSRKLVSLSWLSKFKGSLVIAK